jgi:4'-phosphopantetheinyl transferase
MNCAPEREGPPLAGCLTAAPIRWNPHSSAQPVPHVEVWRADLDALPEGLVGPLAELLCTEERSRAQRMTKEQDRERWMRARGVLRALLGHHLQSDPRALSFRIGAHGKPALAEGELSFNISHSAGLAVYALARDAPLGVDVEALHRRPSRDDLALAEHLFGAELAGRLRALAPAERRREFLREWVRHEAALKCLGVGLSGPPPSQAATAELWSAELDVGPEAAAGLAVGTQAP